MIPLQQLRHIANDAAGKCPQAARVRFLLAHAPKRGLYLENSSMPSQLRSRNEKGCHRIGSP